MTSRKILIAPSILSADFTHLASEIEDVERAGCDLVHVDVMDGHFVPNLTIGPVVVKWMRKATQLPLDVHLMIEEPERYIDDFKRAGADWLTVHYEACNSDLGGTVQKIKRAGLKCGVSLKPGTAAEVLGPFLQEIDLVLVMTVEPGFGGQVFMPDGARKIPWFRERFPGLISVDGGINPETAREVVALGADILVAGSSIFGYPDRRAAIQALLGRGRS